MKLLKVLILTSLSIMLVGCSFGEEENGFTEIGEVSAIITTDGEVLDGSDQHTKTFVALEDTTLYTSDFSCDCDGDIYFVDDETDYFITEKEVAKGDYVTVYFMLVNDTVSIEVDWEVDTIEAL